MAFKYKINDKVKFDQGDKPWDKKGTGVVIMQQEYPTCNAYTIDLDGKLVQVREELIQEKI